MLLDSFTAFYSVLAGASAGLIGLLFVSFSIYVTQIPLSELDKQIGRIYFHEFFISLSISLMYLLSPSFWWIGAFLSSLLSLTYSAIVFIKNWDYVKPRQKNKPFSFNTRDWYPEERMLRLLTFIIPGTVFICSILGGIASIFQNTAHFNFVPLLITSSAAVWLVLSASLGAWNFLLRGDVRQKHAATQGTSTSQGEEKK